MERIFDNIRNGKPSLGITLRGGPDLVDFIGQAGFDFVIPDMMFSRLDWSEVFHMIRSAHAAGMACYPRIQAYPWASDRPDRRLAVDAARALSMGADGACMSVSGAEEVKEVVTVTGDWHRGVAVTSGKQAKELEEKVRTRTLIMPLVEADSAMREVDRIIDVEGLTGIFVAWTDFTKQLGLDLQYEHPEVLKLVGRIIDRARNRGLVVIANTGYIFQNTESNAQRIHRMAAMGVQLVMVQAVQHVLFCALRDMANRVEELRANRAEV